MIDKPIVSPEEAVARIAPGATVMVGGFLACGTAAALVGALVAAGTPNLTLISSDTAFDDPKTGKRTGVAHLIANNQVSRVIASHIGTNRETQRRMNAGEMTVELVPQGTLAERIRAGGVGLGGILTPTGLGTEVADGKQIIDVQGTSYLLEEALRADVALIRAERADTAGNLLYSKTTRNFNPLMAMAGDLVIVEAEEIVRVGELDPEAIVTPGVFVDLLVRDRRGT